MDDPLKQMDERPQSKIDHCRIASICRLAYLLHSTYTRHFCSISINSNTTNMIQLFSIDIILLCLDYDYSIPK